MNACKTKSQMVLTHARTPIVPIIAPCLFQALPQSVRDKWAGQEEKAELMRLSVVSGSAGYLVYEASSHDPFRGFQSDTGRRMARRAELLAAEWRNGVRAMGGGEEEGGDGCAVGRFPDRDGVFHWD